MKHLRTNYPGWIAWVCLLGAGLAGLLISSHYRRTPVPGSSEPARLDPLPPGGAGVVSSGPEVQENLARRASAARQDRQDTGWASPDSPGNSEDPDRNRAWARTYPAEALDWALKAAGGPQREAVIEAVCPQMAETNAAEAVALAERIGPANGVLLENMVLLWTEQDPAAARAWALGRPAGADRDRLMGRVVFVESKTHPEQAARLVVEQMLPGADQDEAAMSVMHQWALRDAGAAMAWAQLFPTGALRDRAIQEVQHIMNPPEGQPEF